MTDSAALDIIAELLSEVEWAPDHLDQVVEVIRATGRAIDDVSD